MIYIFVSFFLKLQLSASSNMYTGVPHFRGFHLHNFHYGRSHNWGFWLMYVQVGDFHVSRGSPTVQLTQILHNAVFFKSQNPCKAGALCIVYFCTNRERDSSSHDLYKMTLGITSPERVCIHKWANVLARNGNGGSLVLTASKLTNERLSFYYIHRL